MDDGAEEDDIKPPCFLPAEVQKVRVDHLPGQALRLDPLGKAQADLGGDVRPCQETVGVLLRDKVQKDPAPRSHIQNPVPVPEESQEAALVVCGAVHIA